MIYYECKARKCAIEWLGEFDSEQWDSEFHYGEHVHELTCFLMGHFRDVAKDQRRACAADVAGVPHRDVDSMNAIDAHSAAMNAEIEDCEDCHEGVYYSKERK